MRVPQSTVIHLDHVPASVRRRLRAAIVGGEGLRPTLAAPRRLAPVAAGATAALSLAAVVVAAALTDRPGPAGLLAVAAAVGLAAAALAVTWERWRDARTMPFPPGCYLIGAFLLDARRPLLELIAVARTRPEIRRRLGRHDLVCTVAPGVQLRLPVGDTDEVHRALALVHGDLIAYATALATGDRVTAARLDPLGDLRDREGVVVGEPRRRRPGHRVARTGALLVLTAAALGAALAPLVLGP